MLVQFHITTSTIWSELVSDLDKMYVLQLQFLHWPKSLTLLQNYIKWYIDNTFFEENSPPIVYTEARTSVTTFWTDFPLTNLVSGFQMGTFTLKNEASEKS